RRWNKNQSYATSWLSTDAPSRPELPFQTTHESQGKRAGQHCPARLPCMPILFALFLLRHRLVIPCSIRIWLPEVPLLAGWFHVGVSTPSPGPTSYSALARASTGDTRSAFRAGTTDSSNPAASAVTPTIMS